VGHWLQAASGFELIPEEREKSLLLAATTALVVTLFLAGAALAPWMAVLAMVFLLVRAWLLLGPFLPRLPAMTVEIGKSIMGGILVLMLMLSWLR
jgi:hypothetical protein